LNGTIFEFVGEQGSIVGDVFSAGLGVQTAIAGRNDTKTGAGWAGQGFIITFADISRLDRTN